MNPTCVYRWARPGHTLIKLLVIGTISAALTVVIKSFMHAAECYADAAQILNALGG